MNSTTIIISNYNYKAYLLAAMASCIDQSVPCDIIVVDDASTDGSWQIAKDFKQELPDRNIKLVKLKKNSGGNARGKNVGIALCETEFVVCLDSDDILLPESIKNRIKLFDEDIDWVHGRALRIKTNGNYKKILERVRNTSAERLIAKDMYRKEVMKLPEDYLKWYKCVEASTVIARRSCYDKVGLYDEDLKWKIDREMWYRFLRHGIRKKFTKEPVSVYRIHDRQVTKDRRRKNPAKVDRMFAEIIVKRKKIITPENTIMLPNYGANKYISEIIE